MKDALDQLRQKILGVVLDKTGSILPIIALLIILISIPLTIYLVGQRQNLKPKADAVQVKLLFSEAEATIAVGSKAANDQFNVEVFVDMASQYLNGVDITLELSESLQVVNRFQFEGGIFSDILVPNDSNSGYVNNTNPRTVRFAAVNRQTENLKTGVFKLGTLQVKARVATSDTDVIRFGNVQVVSSVQDNPLPVDKNGTVNFSGIPPVNSPTPTPTTAVAARIPGDADRDGCVDDEDYDIWEREKTTGQGRRADFNNDGRVDNDDYDIQYDHRGEGCR